MYTGYDESRTEDEMFGVNMCGESAAYKVLVPPGVSNDTGKNLINGSIDVAALPGKNGSSGGGTENAMDMVQELASTMVEGLHGGDAFRNEGRVRADPNYHNGSRNYLAKIKDL
jgi:hypothetical protein